MKYFYTFFIIIFTQISYANEIYIGATAESFKDSQRHFTDDECSNNSLLVNSLSSNNPKSIILIKLNVAQGTATVSVGLNKGEGIYHANIWEFPRPGKEETTKVFENRYTYTIREEGESTHYLQFNRVTLSGTFWSDDDIAPCSRASYADWDEGVLLNEDEFKSDYGLANIVSRNTFLDTTYEMMYQELKKF